MSHAKRSESLDRLRSARPIDLKVVRMCFRTAEALLTPLRIFLTGGPGYLRLAQGLRRLTQGLRGLRKAYARLTQGVRGTYMHKGVIYIIELYRGSYVKIQQNSFALQS